MLQDNKTVEKKVINAGEIILKAEYLSIMKSNTNWYCKKIGTKDNVVIATRTIVHSCLDVLYYTVI